MQFRRHRYRLKKGCFARQNIVHSLVKIVATRFVKTRPAGNRDNILAHPPEARLKKAHLTFSKTRIVVDLKTAFGAFSSGERIVGICGFIKVPRLKQTIGKRLHTCLLRHNMQVRESVPNYFN